MFPVTLDTDATTTSVVRIPTKLWTLFPYGGVNIMIASPRLHHAVSLVLVDLEACVALLCGVRMPFLQRRVMPGGDVVVMFGRNTPYSSICLSESESVQGYAAVGCCCTHSHQGESNHNSCFGVHVALM
jgi:hypothetical protein